MRAVIIDAMGDPQRTAQVYAWAARNRSRVFPAQGVHAPATPVAYAPQEYFPGPKGERVKIPGGILLHKVDTTMFKGVLASKLAIAPGDPGAFHLHSGDGLLAYAREMCAEVWNPEKNLWDNPKGRPNHAFDCEYLLWALHWMLGIAKKSAPALPSPRPRFCRRNPFPVPSVLSRIVWRLFPEVMMETAEKRDASLTGNKPANCWIAPARTSTT